MAKAKTTVRVKLAGAITLTACLFSTGCNSTPRAEFLRTRTVIHASNSGSGKQLAVEPVLARLDGYGQSRR